MSFTNMPSTLCRQFANILGGTAEVVNGVCTVTRIRSNLRPLIEGRRTNSALALAALFSFENLDRRGNALNLGETVILQEEINPFISALRVQGIEVTALHNHWLFDNPRLMFIHFKSIEPPLVFAAKVAGAFRVLTTQTVSPTVSPVRSGGRSMGGRSFGGRSFGGRSLEGRALEGRALEGRSAGTATAWGTCNCPKTGSASAGATRSPERSVGVMGISKTAKSGKSGKR